MPIVTVSITDGEAAKPRDFEIPSSMTVRDIADKLLVILGQMGDLEQQVSSFEIEAVPLGRKLEPDETLEGAGVWDGSLLFLGPVAKPEEVVTEVAVEKKSPLVGWKKLDNALPKGRRTKTRQSKSFVWKRLD